MKRFPCSENQKEHFWNVFHMYKMNKHFFETLSFLQNEKAYSCGVGRGKWLWSGWRIYKSNKRDSESFSFIQVKLHNFEVLSFSPIKMHFREAFFICPRLPKFVQSVQSCPILNTVQINFQVVKNCSKFVQIIHLYIYFDHIWGP